MKIASNEAPEPQDQLVERVARQLQARGWMLATAESCTGGLIAAGCTAISGSSKWFERGFVTYTNEAKTDMLGVDAALIAEHGAVSESVAKAMAQGALIRSRAHISVAVTGVAGPTGGSALKPVGTVWLAWCWRVNDGQTEARAQREVFGGGRTAVRAATVERALAVVAELAAE